MDKTAVSGAKNNSEDLALVTGGLSKLNSGHHFHSINIATYTCDFGNIIVGKSV